MTISTAGSGPVDTLHASGNRSSTTARGPRVVRFDLARIMRKHGVTIRELASRMEITMKRVREVRALKRVDYLLYCDYTQAVTGQKVFSRARFDAMQREER